MQVTVIGAGNMGSAFVKQLAPRRPARCSVTARDSAKAAALAAQHPGVVAVPAAGAAAEAPTRSCSPPAMATRSTALRSVGDLAGKVVIDITNPLTADYMGLTDRPQHLGGRRDRQGRARARRS